MRKYIRNKLVSVVKKGTDEFRVHGVLDDDIYGLEIDLSMRISTLEIMEIDGRWNRWTTPDCSRAVPLLQDAVGMRMGEGFTEKIQKEVGRKSCRHFANLLLECCHSAKEAAIASKEYEDAAEDVPLSGDTPPVNLKTPKDAEGTSKSRGPAEHISAGRTGPVDATGNRSEETIIDLHVHTSPASPCSAAPVEDLVEEAKRIGLGGICLTDHNCVWDSAAIEDLREQHDFLVLRGNEITTDQGDMLVFGFETPIEGIISLEELRKEVTTAGGVIIAAHPFRGFLTFGVAQLGLTPEKAMERPLFSLVDGVEVLNSKVTEKENRFAKKVARGLGLATIGGSDAHEVAEVGIYATRFLDTIEDECDLVAALKRGACAPVVFRRNSSILMRGQEDKS